LLRRFAPRNDEGQKSIFVINNGFATQTRLRFFCRKRNEAKKSLPRTAVSIFLSCLGMKFRAVQARKLASLKQCSPMFIAQDEILRNLRKGHFFQKGVRGAALMMLTPWGIVFVSFDANAYT